MKTLLLVLVMMINAKVEAQISYWIPSASIVIDNSNTFIQPAVPPQTPAITPILFCRKNNVSANTLVFLTTINNSNVSYLDINGVAKYLDRLVLRYRMSSSNSTGWSNWNELESNGPTTNFYLINGPATNFYLSLVQSSISNNYSLTINLDSLPNMFDKQYSGRIEFELIARNSDTSMTFGPNSHYFSLEVTPPAPSIASISTTASCPSTGTGTIIISDITIYKEARLYLTDNIGTVVYNAGVLQNVNYPHAISTIVISNPLILPGTYYLYVINKDVSEPLKCSINNYPIVIESVPTLQTPLIPVSPLVTTVALLNSPPDWFTSNISNNNVVVNNNANDVFISDFKSMFRNYFSLKVI